MVHKLCGEEECDITQCPEEPCHCEYGMEELQCRAEMRYESALDSRAERHNERAEYGGQE